MWRSQPRSRKLADSANGQRGPLWQLSGVGYWYGGHRFLGFKRVWGSGQGKSTVWAIHKRVGTSSAPLMLGMSDAGSSDDTESVVSGLIEAIKDIISTEEVNAGLAAHGLASADSHEVNISNLARALVA